MNTVTSNQLNTYKMLCRARENSILIIMGNFLKTKYNNVIQTSEYIMAQGTIPVALVAHADTVFKSPPKHFFYDQKQTVMWSPEGAGADDRAGIFAIMQILKLTDLRPHIIITTGEEIGCIGASKLIGDYPVFPWDLKFMIQLDRRGKEDCVFYDCNNPDFLRFIESFGFKTAYGSLSDISVLAPCWKIAATNLSVGYYNEHSYAEFLCFTFLLATIEKVKNILNSVANSPAMEPYLYIPMDTNSNLWSGLRQCDNCYNYVTEEEMIPIRVEELNGETRNLCIECFSSNSHHISYCSKCSIPWIATEDHNLNEQWFCPDCAKGRKNK